jgi:hypothetical protein
MPVSLYWAHYPHKPRNCLGPKLSRVSEYPHSYRCRCFIQLIRISSAVRRRHRVGTCGGARAYRHGAHACPSLYKSIANAYNSRSVPTEGPANITAQKRAGSPLPPTLDTTEVPERPRENLNAQARRLHLHTPPPKFGPDPVSKWHDKVHARKVRKKMQLTSDGV